MVKRRLAYQYGSWLFSLFTKKLPRLLKFIANIFQYNLLFTSANFVYPIGACVIFNFGCLDHFETA